MAETSRPQIDMVAFITPLPVVPCRRVRQSCPQHVPIQAVAAPARRQRVKTSSSRRKAREAECVDAVMMQHLYAATPATRYSCSTPEKSTSIGKGQDLSSFSGAEPYESAEYCTRFTQPVPKALPHEVFPVRRGRNARRNVEQAEYFRQYMFLRRQLKPWSEKFRAAHGRTPSLEDVHKADIPGLLDRFIDYLEALDKLRS